MNRAIGMMFVCCLLNCDPNSTKPTSVLEMDACTNMCGARGVKTFSRKEEGCNSAQPICECYPTHQDGGP